MYIFQGSPIALSAQASTKLPQHPLSCVPLHKVDKWDISHNDIILEEQIGSGFFGTVYRGQVQKDNMDLTSLLSTEGEGRKSYAGFMIVAVKMLQGSLKFVGGCMKKDQLHSSLYNS